jgi:hypothetical protein
MKENTLEKQKPHLRSKPGTPPGNAAANSSMPPVPAAPRGPDIYYEMTGWDEEGMPPRGKLLDLNLAGQAAMDAILLARLLDIYINFTLR